MSSQETNGITNDQTTRARQLQAPKTQHPPRLVPQIIVAHFDKANSADQIASIDGYHCKEKEPTCEPRNKPSKDIIVLSPVSAPTPPTHADLSLPAAADVVASYRNEGTSRRGETIKEKKRVQEKGEEDGRGDGRSEKSLFFIKKARKFIYLMIPLLYPPLSLFRIY